MSIAQLLKENDLILNSEELITDRLTANTTDTFALNVQRIEGLSYGPGNVNLSQAGNSTVQPTTTRGDMYWTRIGEAVNFQLVIDYTTIDDNFPDELLFINFPLLPINPPGDLPFPALFGIEQSLHCDAPVNYVNHPEVRQVFAVAKNEVDAPSSTGRFELRFITTADPHTPQPLTARYITNASGKIRISGVFFLENIN